MFEVGQQVVFMSFNPIRKTYHPVQCNVGNNPQHPCRVTIEKVGRKRYQYTNTTGKHFAPIGCATLFDLATAKKLYQQCLDAYGPSPRNAQLVESL